MGSCAAVTVASLFTRNRHAAKKVARGYFIPGADQDDVEQEALIGLWEACRAFNPKLGVPFGAFAHEVMHRRVSDAITKARRLKHTMLTEAVRAGRDPETGERVDVLDFVASHTLEPAELLVQLDELRGLVGAILGLTELERAAIVRVINGLGPDSKSMDNAGQRAKAKLRKAAA